MNSLNVFVELLIVSASGESGSSTMVASPAACVSLNTSGDSPPTSVSVIVIVLAAPVSFPTRMILKGLLAPPSSTTNAVTPASALFTAATKPSTLSLEESIVMSVVGSVPI